MHGKSFILIVFFIACFFYDNDCMAQHDWMHQCGGITIDEGADVSVDASGNTYATGYFTGAANFGTSSLNSAGLTDIYIAKLKPGGLYQWVVRAGGIGIDRPTSMKTDSAGNSYITGYFYDTAIFGSFSITSSGAQDIFIAKFDNTGVCQWVNKAGGIFGDIGNGITVDRQGNVIVTGEFAGTASFGSTSLTSMNGSVDVFTTKLDANGNFLWAKKGSAHLTDRGLDVATDANGNIFVTGQFTDTITFDVAHNNTMYNAIFLIKYNTAGVEQWFRRIGGGSQNMANSIVTDGFGNPVIAGDFQGALTFFSAPGNTTLNGTYVNKIFVAKFDGNGNKLWSSQSSSDNEAAVKNLAVDGAGNFVVVGNFRCKFNGFADQYGQGTFHSVGYTDIFVSKWNGAGVWQWARQAGGHSDEYGTGIVANAGGEVIITGSFLQDFIMPVRNTLLGYNVTPSVYCTPVYCSDNTYGRYAIFHTGGNSDIFISKTIGPLRQPYDYYVRTSGCDRSEISVCIEGDTTACPDTVSFCQGGTLTANSNTCATIGPGYNYLWSDGSTSNAISVFTSGMYSVTQTSLDGCFVSSDSVYVIIKPSPPTPTISDDVIINTNSNNPLAIDLCLPDSVVLTGGNFGSNAHVWSSQGGPSDTSVSITVSQDGMYFFTVTGANGCASSVGVNVTFYTILPPFIPKLICPSDFDLNDSISLCLGQCFEMFVYDSISNPAPNTTLCLPAQYPYNTLTGWASFPNMPNSALCNARQFFCPTVSDSYLITLLLVRLNICDTDTFTLSKTIFVTVNPVPVLSISVSGDPWLCPGDSNMIVTTGYPIFSWTGPNVNGSTEDTVWATQPGNYSVSCYETNSFGCTGYDNAGISVQYKPQPLITMEPSTGLICPNDSVKLICNGVGTFQWQGPAGPIGGNIDSIYVNQPGNYYCILTDTQFCALVSNTVLVTQYATPFLQLLTDSTICAGDSLIIYVVAGPGSTVIWDLPLTGNAMQQTITAGGTYSCTIISCGIPTTASITIGISTPVAQIGVNGNLTFCEGGSVLLGSNSGYVNYLWLPDSISAQTFSATVAGLYTLVVTDSFGCEATDTISVYTYPNSATSPAVSDTTVCVGEIAVLSASGSGNIYWYPDLTSTVILDSGNTYTTPIIFVDETYYVQTEDSGCRSVRVPVHVFVDACDTFYVPNVFTPNVDGLNDIFYFTVPDNACFHARIFNRWGLLMYEGRDATEGWNGKNQSNGKPASDGVYYYVLNYCDYVRHRLTAHGFLELLR